MKGPLWPDGGPNYNVIILLFSTLSRPTETRPDLAPRSGPASGRLARRASWRAGASRQAQQASGSVRRSSAFNKRNAARLPFRPDGHQSNVPNQAADVLRAGA